MAGRENSSACKQTTPAAYILTSRKRLGPGFSFAHDPHEIGASPPFSAILAVARAHRARSRSRWRRR